MTGRFKLFIQCTSGEIEECFDNFTPTCPSIEERKEKSQHSKIPFTMGEGTMWRSFCLALHGRWRPSFFCISILFPSLYLYLSLFLSLLFFSLSQTSILSALNNSHTWEKLYFLQVLTNKRIAYNWKDFRMPLFHQRHFYSTILFSSFEKVPALSKSARIRTLDNKFLLVVPSTILYLRSAVARIFRLNVIFFLWNKFWLRSWHTISMALNNFASAVIGTVRETKNKEIRKKI